MNKVSLYTLIGLFALCSCACGGKDPVPSTDPDPKPEPPVEVYDATLWTTTFDKTRDFQKSGVAFGKAATMSPNVVRRLFADPRLHRRLGLLDGRVHLVRQGGDGELRRP